jgi:hypothetical protein
MRPQSASLKIKLYHPQSNGSPFPPMLPDRKML